MDFTIDKYQELLQSLRINSSNFLTFHEFLQKGKESCIVLRHDVDLLPENSMKFAEIQFELGIRGTYYFRIVSESFNEGIVRKISDLGHEIGYHYETMDSCNGYIDKAFDEFQRNLEIFRKLYPVTTICMHGSPKSKFDNKDIWNNYDYESLGIIGEPYLDIDFNQVFYLTDTGRRWDGYKVSVRDKLPQQERWNQQGFRFHNTDQIINAITLDKFPKKVMMTFHPQRWHDRISPWLNEFVSQNAKNLIKYYLIKI
jgi:hypothetical protein